MRLKSLFLLILSCQVLVFFSGCYLDPKKVYVGPEQPKKDLALIMQTDYLDSRLVFIVAENKTAGKEIRIDDLGITVLPGTYIFRAKLYRHHFATGARLDQMTVIPGQSDFPIQQPVPVRVIDEKPYKETGDSRLSVKAGFRYGVWCNDQDQIVIKTLGPYTSD
ncbi:MAG: hypothetical protein KJ573_05025 [Proteobacteria bacterium]|nr:hypothetical protein [Pseudomonadota bacterium]